MVTKAQASSLHTAIKITTTPHINNLNSKCAMTTPRPAYIQVTHSSNWAVDNCPTRPCAHMHTSIPSNIIYLCPWGKNWNNRKLHSQVIKGHKRGTYTKLKWFVHAHSTHEYIIWWTTQSKTMIALKVYVESESGWFYLHVHVSHLKSSPTDGNFATRFATIHKKQIVLDGDTVSRTM